MIKASSKIQLDFGKIHMLTRATEVALEQTAEALRTEVQQAQVMPFDTGALQNDFTFVDDSEISQGIAVLVSSTPYARRLYFHPEYDFQTAENSNAKGEWYKDWLPGGIYENYASETFKRFYKKAGGV